MTSNEAGDLPQHTLAAERNAGKSITAGSIRDPCFTNKRPETCSNCSITSSSSLITHLNSQSNHDRALLVKARTTQEAFYERKERMTADC